MGKKDEYYPESTVAVRPKVAVLTDGTIETIVMKTFFPIRHIDVASSGSVNGSSACYRVAFGIEHRGDKHAYVYKILVCNDGKVSGRLNPAFLHGSDDFARVSQAMSDLSDQVRASGLVAS
ncbi:hypothetical protein JL100_013095 [Skermanella mucosa]|uniref:hypothetical protein n=1 Tax=Skermanella mucosa TaxID=1789672 RepID=UPI00192B2812|nr:hypothetical protein [Skermanella mucosa]UEM23626.1 hypothetical protein JL100_013095 [Skermanella mucosa]